MSGPKYGIGYLDERVMNRLLQQRSAIEKMILLKNEISSLLENSNIKMCLQMLDEEIDSVEQSSLDVNGQRELVNAIQEIKNRLVARSLRIENAITENCRKIENLVISSNNYNSLEDIEKNTSNLNISARNCQSDFDFIASEIKEAISVFELEKRKVHGNIVWKEDSSCIKKISNASIENQKTGAEVKLKTKKNYSSYRQFIYQVKDNKQIPIQDMKNIQGVCKQFEDMVAYAENNTPNEDEEKEIDKFYRIIQGLVSEVNKKAKKQYDDYCVKCEILKLDRKKIVEFKDVEEMVSECNNLAKLIDNKEKVEYLAHNIEEVMNELGHEVISSEVFSDVDCSFNRKIYEYDDNSVISVTQSETGAIVMEVKVVSESDILTDGEKKQAVDSMLSFCQQYPDVVEKLEERGIKYQRKEEMPATEEFAEKITVSDYHNKKADQKRKRRLLNEPIYKSMS